MGLRSRWRTLVAAATVQASGRPGRSGEFSWVGSPWSAGGIYGGASGAVVAPRVSRSEALQVPAVMRGRNLICGSLAALPLRCIDAKRKPVRLALLEQIDPFVPNVVTLAQTFEDLLFEGISWWQIVGFAPGGAGGGALWPSRARHVDVSAVSMSPPEGFPLHTLPSGAYPNGVVWVMGEPVPAENMIRFDSPNPPLLTHGARAIRRALKLEQAADMYADDPRAQGYFVPGDGADPADDDEIEDILSAWQAARRRRSVGYVPLSLKYVPLEVMSPAELQLAELQTRANLALANLMGIDPEDLGISTTSRTYQNAVDRRQDRINETYAAYLKAVSDRLSMGDVTPPGQRTVWDLDDFLKADPKTRWETYRIARGLDAIEVDEIRDREDLPELEPRPQPQQPVRPKAPAVPAQQQEEAPVPVQQSAVPASLRFAAEPSAVTFAFAGGAEASFAVDMAARTITGLAVPYGPVARSGWSNWRFRKGCLKYSDVSRVKLLRDHDTCEAIGVATAIEDTDAGLRCTFRIARGEDGDEALILAEDGVLDGLSVGLDFSEPDAWQPDPVDESVRLVVNANLREVSLCAIPAFDSARVDGVKASRTADGRPVVGTATPEGEFTMPPTATTEPQAPAAPAAAPAAEAQQFTATIDTTAFAGAVEAFTAAVERLGAVPQEQRQVVPVGQATVREPLTYSLDGNGPSFVRDAWTARTTYGAEADEALSRLRKYSQQTAELSAAAASARFANAGNTTDQAQIIPPGYRPDLYVGQIPQGRPLFEAMSRGTIVNATPFKVPVWVGSSGLSGTNVENTGPSTGTITDHTYRTVTPSAQSGEFIISRELVDASNPAIDQIALAAMREEYSQDTEAVIATALAGATDNDTGAGQSTEGCYVYANVGDGVDLSQKLRVVEGEFPFHRYTVAPNRILLSSRGFGAFTSAFDSSGRPLFPYLAPQNAPGTVGGSAQSLNIDGLAGTPAWALTAGTDDVVVFNSVDAWAWESPLLTFRFEEKAGPESIVLNLWGYFAFQILRYTGIHAISHTGA